MELNLANSIQWRPRAEMKGPIIRCCDCPSYSGGKYRGSCTETDAKVDAVDWCYRDQVEALKSEAEVEISEPDKGPVEVGPVSQAILDYVNSTFGFISFNKLQNAISDKLNSLHPELWYYRRLVALALEGRIEADVRRDGDKLLVKFRRLQEAKGVGE